VTTRLEYTFVCVESVHSSVPSSKAKISYLRIYCLTLNNKIDIHRYHGRSWLDDVIYSTFFNVKLLIILSKTIESLAISDCGHFEDCNAILVIQPKIQNWDASSWSEGDTLYVI